MLPAGSEASSHKGQGKGARNRCTSGADLQQAGSVMQIPHSIFCWQFERRVLSAAIWAVHKLCCPSNKQLELQAHKPQDISG